MNNDAQERVIHGTVVSSGHPEPAADDPREPADVATPVDQEDQDQEEERPGATHSGYARAAADRGDGDEVIDADAVIIEEVDEVPTGDEPPADDEAPEPVAGFARTPVSSSESATGADAEADTSAEDAEADTSAEDAETAAAVDHDAAEAATVPEPDVIAEAARPGVPAEVSEPARPGVPGGTGELGGTASPAAAGVAADPGQLHEQWSAIQSSFVDDPRASVAAAAELVNEAIAALVASVQERERGLRSEWERDGADTEDLRNTLRGYRGLLDQLAAR